MKHLALILTLLFVGCNHEQAERALTGGAEAAQEYTYRIRISATDTNYVLNAITGNEDINNQNESIVGTDTVDFYVTGPGLNLDVNRSTGPGHLNILVQRDGVNVFQDSITTSSGSMGYVD